MYVAAMHDSFPHMQELAKQGYHAFALIYRPGAQTACEDLARAVAFIQEHAEEFQVHREGYSLWGGSAGQEWRHGLVPMERPLLGRRSIRLRGR